MHKTFNKGVKAHDRSIVRRELHKGGTGPLCNERGREVMAVGFFEMVQEDGQSVGMEVFDCVSNGRTEPKVIVVFYG